MTNDQAGIFEDADSVRRTPQLTGGDAAEINPELTSEPVAAAASGSAPCSALGGNGRDAERAMARRKWDSPEYLARLRRVAAKAVSGDPAGIREFAKIVIRYGEETGVLTFSGV